MKRTFRANDESSKATLGHARNVLRSIGVSIQHVARSLATAVASSSRRMFQIQVPSGPNETVVKIALELERQ
jgi:antitoxin component of RelBE/YafQ-DinJ toxin-antitoxin module